MSGSIAVHRHRDHHVLHAGERVRGRVLVQLTSFFRAIWVATPSALVIATITLMAVTNGYVESSSWQFVSTNQKTANIAALDMLERKKGGYYDGFTTTIYNSTITNIGTQLNCSNIADAKGNQAQNSQGGSNGQLNAAANIDSSSVGNDSLTGTDSGTGTTDTNQTNSGELNSSVTGSEVETTTGGIINGATDNDLNNNQDNSGDQSATIADSVACAMDGSTITGNVDGTFSGQQLTAPLN
jgi:hypothetical protein